MQNCKSLALLLLSFMNCNAVLAMEVCPPEFQEQRTVTKFNYANSIAEIVIEALPPETKSQLGLRAYTTETLEMGKGYSHLTLAKYYTALEMIEDQALLLPKDILLEREVMYTWGVIKLYIKLMELNKQHQRLSVFLPLTYSDANDAIAPLAYIFSSLSSLRLKNYSKSIIGHRLRNYLRQDCGRTPFIRGVLQEIRHLLQTYQQTGMPIIYPVKRQLEDIINHDNNKAMMGELAQSLDRLDLPLMAILREQVAEYVDFITSEILPHAPEETQLPREIYQVILKLHGVYEEPEILIERATNDYALLKEKAAKLTEELSHEYNLTSTNPVEVLQRLEQETTLKERDQIVALYLKAQEEIVALINKEKLITLPHQPLQMRLGTAAEELLMPMPHVSPPTFIGNDGSDRPEFVLCDVNTHANPLVAYPLIVHEGMPGHVLQFSRMVDLFLEKKIDLIQTALASNSTNVEGWAHYVEYLMTPYFAKEAQLGALRDQLLRQARLFLDPQLNLGLITHAQAMRFIKEDVGFLDSVARSEADRYCYSMPGQATTYRYGCQKLMDFRDEVEKEMGDKFNLQSFHDAIIAYGLLPLDMTADLIKRQLTS